MASQLLTIYDSGTITGNGNSGVLDIRDLMGDPLMTGCFQRAFLRLVPAGLTTDETLDLDLNLSWDAAGSGDVKVHDFTQVTSTNAAETVILPGGESVGNLTSGTDFQPAILLPFWKLTWVLGGTTKSMSFILYGALEW